VTYRGSFPAAPTLIHACCLGTLATMLVDFFMLIMYVHFIATSGGSLERQVALWFLEVKCAKRVR
jgi:hypothetical protein